MSCDKVQRCARTAPGVRHANGDRKRTDRNRKKRTIPPLTIPLHNSCVYSYTTQVHKSQYYLGFNCKTKCIFFLYKSK